MSTITILVPRELVGEICAQLTQAAHQHAIQGAHGNRSQGVRLQHKATSKALRDLVAHIHEEGQKQR